MDGFIPGNNATHHTRNSFFKASALLLVSLLSTSALDARADDSGNNETRAARFTGPLVSSSPPLPKGLWNIEPYLIESVTTGYYDDNGGHHDTGNQQAWRLAVPMMYGVTERLSLGATLNAVWGHEPGGRDGVALGDTTLSALYLLADPGGDHSPKLTAALRQNVDTGHHDKLDQRSTSLATGSGAATTTLALYGQAYYLERTLRARVNLSWRLPHSGVGVHGRSAYGTDAGFDGHADLGSAFEATVGLEYSLGPHWALAMDMVYETEQGATVTGQATDAFGNAVAVDRTGPSSRRLSLAPAVEYHWNDNVGLIFGAFKSVAGRNAGDVFAPQVAVNVAF